MGMGQNPIPLVNMKIAGKWMFIPLKMVCIGIDPYPYPVIMIAAVLQSVLGRDSDIKLLRGSGMCMGLQTYLNGPPDANVGRCGKIVSRCIKHRH